MSRLFSVLQMLPTSRGNCYLLQPIGHSSATIYHNKPIMMLLSSRWTSGHTTTQDSQYPPGISTTTNGIDESILRSAFSVLKRQISLSAEQTGIQTHISRIRGKFEKEINVKLMTLIAGHKARNIAIAASAHAIRPQQYERCSSGMSERIHSLV
jgi:hypothetical protein